MSHHQEFQSRHSLEPTPKISPQPLIRAKGPTSKIFDVDGLKPEYAPKQESRFQSSQFDHLPHSRVVQTSVLDVRENYHMKSPFGSDLQGQLNKLRDENLSLKQQLQEALQSLEQSMVQSQFAQNENENSDSMMKQLQQKLALFEQERQQQFQEIHKLKEQTQEQKDIIELQQMQIEGLLMEKASLQNSVSSNKKIVAFKDQHIESLMEKMKKIQAQHKEEISQLHSENEFLHKAHLELITERTSLSSTLTDAQNEAMFHQSFAEKHHAKRREIEERSREQFQALQDEIESLKEQLRNRQH